MYQYNSNFPPYKPMSQTVNPTVNSQLSSFAWVNGIEMATNWPVPLGSSMIMMDSQNPLLYIKSVDQAGRILPIEVYDLVKREQDPKESFITRREVEDLFDKYLGGKQKTSNKNKKRDDVVEVDD